MSLSRRVAALRDDDAGFTLIEIMVALVVFGLLSAAVLATILQGKATSRQDRLRVVAANLAAAQLETVRDQPTALIVPGQAVISTTVDGLVYTMTQNVQYALDSTSQSSCDSASTNGIAYKRITETVTWPAMGSAKPVRTDTLRAVNISGLDPTKGAVSVKVTDNTGTGQPGYPVSLTQGAYTAATQSTGDDGCVVFTGVPAGTATVTASLAGFVDQQGNATASSSTIGVTAATLTKATLIYDEAATIQLTPSSAQAPATVSLTLYNSALLPSGAKGFRDCGVSASPCATGSPRTVSQLFPFTGGYLAWAGSCADADPGTYAGGSRGAAIIPQPAGSASGTVPVVVVTAKNTYTSAATLYAEHTADTGCTTGELYNLGTVAVGASATVALPYGQWIFSRTGTVHTATINDSTVTVKPTGTTGSPATVK